MIAKHNFTTSDAQTAQYEGEPWITVMAKIEGYCAPTVGGNCLGGEWFYYLYRGGEFKQFTGVPVYGKPQAFCTDCHNPVAKADFLWNLHLYVRGREAPYGPDIVPPSPVQPVTPPPSALCAEGALGIGPQPPADVPFDPASLPDGDRQAMFDCFSWRTFNALNWPAASGERGVPDTGGSLGDLGAPRVWETFKETAEVFQPDDPTWTLDDRAWNDPQFVPEICQSEIDGLPEPERAKILRMITKTRAHQVLNETHQAMGNQFNILVDQSGKLIQYEVRLNRDEFEYVKANQMADTGSVRRIPCNVVDLLWADGGLFVEKQIPKPSCYTMQPRSGSGELKLRNTTMETFQAAWKGPGTSAASQVSSQSCFNCHGFSGVDFSFLWTDATEEIIPFPPPSSTPPTTGP